MKPSTQNIPSESVRVLKSATCPSLSGKSKLSYEVGCTDASQIHVRIVANSAAGSFSREWVDMQAIRAALDKCPRGAPITSAAIASLFRGTSTNNQLFAWAVLKNEGLVRHLDGDKRGYERAESVEFVTWTRALIEGKGATAIANSKNKRAKPDSATRTKKPAASTKSKKSPS